MPPQTSSTETPMQLLAMTNGLAIHQALYAAAKLGVADLLKDGPQTSSALAGSLHVNESALYRLLRLLASQSVFEEQSPRTFANTELSHFLCTGVPVRFAPFLFSGGATSFSDRLRKFCTASRLDSRPEPSCLGWKPSNT
jgi:hypothetical protein